MRPLVDRSAESVRPDDATPVMICGSFTPRALTSPEMLLFQRRKCGSASFVPPVPPVATAAISFAAVALALFGLPLVTPLDSHAQETSARDEEAASTVQVKWQGPLAPDVAWILGSYYGLAQTLTKASSGCSTGWTRRHEMSPRSNIQWKVELRATPFRRLSGPLSLTG